VIPLFRFWHQPCFFVDRRHSNPKSPGEIALEGASCRSHCTIARFGSEVIRGAPREADVRVVAGGKFHVLSAGVDVSSWLAVGAVVVGSVLGLYYYLRVVATMLQAPPGTAMQRSPAALTASIALGVLLLLVVGLGVAPAPVQDLVSLAFVGAR
jgi:hypothetical protein